MQVIEFISFLVYVCVLVEPRNGGVKEMDMYTYNTAQHMQDKSREKKLREG